MKFDIRSAAHFEPAEEEKPERGLKAFLTSKRGIFAVVSVLAAVLVIVIAITVSTISDNREYRKYFNAGMDSFYSGDYENALASLRRAASIEERDDCLLYIADCYTEMGKYDKALEILHSMKTSDANVAHRISKVNDLIREQEEAEKVTVAGKLYPANTTSLVLNSMNLGEAVLEELTQLYALESLSLADNTISDISHISSLGGLITLDLSRNEISNLAPLSRIAGLRTLYLDANPIEDFSPLYSLKNLATLSIKGIEITESQLEALSSALPDCAIHCEETTADILEITLGGRSFKSDVTELDLSGLALRDISALSNCKQLTKLILSNNNISDLSPLMDIPTLYYLDISANAVTDIRPLMGISSLGYLYAADNTISSTVPLGNLRSLAVLDLNRNPILDFSGLRKLSSIKNLSLVSTGLTEDGINTLMGLSTLGYLDITGNTDISGESVDALKAALIQCVVSHSELSYSIEIGGRSFKNSDTVLELGGLAISDLSPLSAFYAPEIINLSNNQISNIYVFQHCTAVKSLNLAGNFISDITPIASLQKLEALDLSNNLVSDLTPLFALQNLQSLNLSGNALSVEQIDELCMMLPQCTIYY